MAALLPALTEETISRMLRSLARLTCLVLFVLGAAYAQDAAAQQPIIDMHLHAQQVRPGALECVGGTFLGVDPMADTAIQPGGHERLHSCPDTLRAPASDEENLRTTLAILERYNIRAVTSGPPSMVLTWKAAAPDRIIPAIECCVPMFVTPDSMRQLFSSGTIAVMGEVVNQYFGATPSDSVLAPYFAMAEELDVPVGIHVGLGPVGVAYTAGNRSYRAALGRPLLLEETLLRHPKMRLYVMHAGWPLLDEMIALLYAHPQVYVDVGVINWILPRKEFHHYLRRLVEAGFGKRVMFGSDNVIWPDAIPIAIDAIESADFLTGPQKRDIFYNNAARFLRLSDEEIARHHGR